MSEFDLPSLRPDEGVMLVAFEGWNDAGSAAATALNHVAELWEAQDYAVLDSEDFHDFQVNRPNRTRTEDGGYTLSWPGTVVSTTQGPGFPPRNLSLVRGIEPSMRWRQFAGEIVEHALDLGVETIITCGALIMDAPHTRPLPMFISSDDPDTRERFELERSQYEGPVGIISVIAHEARNSGINVISLWAGVPHYVPSSPSPKASIALLNQLERFLGLAIDLGDLPAEAEAWVNGADDFAQSHTDVAALVEQLESVMDATTLPEASGDAIAAEFERFLRRRDDGGPKPTQ